MSAPKLPLLVRKNIKDDFEGRKSQLAAKYKEVFGEDYTFEVDFPTLYTHADEGYQQNGIGTIAYDAIEGAARWISDDTRDDTDKILIKGFNDAASKRIITVVADPDFKGYYCGCRANDGVWEIVFKPKGLGTNSYSASEHWRKAINEASTKSSVKALPPTARFSIKKDFEDKKKELEDKISDQLGDERLTLHVDFEDIWSKIIDAHDALPKKNKDDINVEYFARSIGSIAYDYFWSLLDKLTRELDGDDMMIEGFFDEVTTKEAWLGLLAESEELKDYSVTTIEDGKLWSKTKTTKFGVNTYTGFADFSKLL